MDNFKLSLAVFLIISLLSLLFLAWEASHAPEDDPDLPAYDLTEKRTFLMSNIYYVKINTLPDWIVEMASENRLDAAIKILQDIKDAPADSDFQELAHEDLIDIRIELIAANTTLEVFEKSHPEAFDAYF